VLACALAMASCAPSTPAPRANLDPLFRGSGGTGEYPVDPAELDRRAPTPRVRRGDPPPAPPLPEPGRDASLPCKHTWEWLDRETHPYVNRDGSITLCTPRVCTQCGLLIHECGRHGR
jgi:hypothetical protein